MSDPKFDPSWKETANLPGEMYSEVNCTACGRILAPEELKESVQPDDDESVFCQRCAERLDALWEADWDRHIEEYEEE